MGPGDATQQPAHQAPSLHPKPFRTSCLICSSEISTYSQGVKPTVPRWSSRGFSVGSPNTSSGRAGSAPRSCAHSAVCQLM